MNNEMTKDLRLKVHTTARLDSAILFDVRQVAQNERRSFTNMLEVLLIEALEARKRQAEKQ